MPFILRKIKRARWYGRDVFPWLTEGEIQADHLGDLYTSDNKLSVWLVENIDQDLKKVVTALASNSTTVSNIDYALLDKTHLSGIGVKFEKELGVTPYEEVNSLHYNLIELTASKLVGLSKVFMAESKRDRFIEPQVTSLLKTALGAGQIAQEKLNEKLKASLERRS